MDASISVTFIIIAFPAELETVVLTEVNVAAESVMAELFLTPGITLAAFICTRFAELIIAVIAIKKKLVS